VLVAAFALLVPTLWGLLYFFTDGLYTSVRLSALLRVRRDDYVKASYDTAMLKLHPPRGLAIYVVGGSAAREAFTTERDLETAIAAAGGGRTRVAVLASNMQTLGESFAIIDNLPPSTRAMCVIAVNQVRFEYRPGVVEQQLAGKHLLLNSPHLRRYVFKHYHRGVTTPTILPGVLDFVSGWFDKHIDDLVHGRLPRVKYILHRYHQGHQWTDEKKRRLMARSVRNRVSPGGTFDRYFRYNLGLLEEMVKVAQGKGFTVVLLELPLNGDIVGHAFDRVKSIYQPALERLARRHGAVYLRAFSEKGLVDEDFRDLTHLVPSGRVKYQAAFVRATVPLLQRLEAGVAAQELTRQP
jgi:hypothetical protein